MTHSSGWDCDIRQYRCFTFVYEKGGGVRVRFMLRHANYHIPRSFVWKGEEQTDLLRYIDGWIDHKQLVREMYEKAGMVEALEFAEPTSKAPVIYISAHLLLSILRGEMPLSVTADTQLTFRNVLRENKKDASSRFFPTSILAELVSSDLAQIYAQCVKETAQRGEPILLEGFLQKAPSVGKTRSIRAATDINLQYALQEGSGISMPSQEPEEPEELEGAEPSCITETLVSSSEVCGVTEVISLASGGEREFFVLRRYDRDTMLLSTATSWLPTGPWTVSGSP